MKNGKRLTRREMMLVTAAKLKPDDWLVCKRLPTELHLVHRYVGSTTKVIFIG